MLTSDHRDRRSLDELIANRERYGRWDAPCLDCEVGEPHCCPKLQPEYMARNRRAIQILDDLAVLST